MRLFFKRSSAGAARPADSSAGTTTAELPLPTAESTLVESHIDQARFDEAQPEQTKSHETKIDVVTPSEEVPRASAFVPKKHLVSASELPSAAGVLADLFREDVPAPSFEHQPHVDDAAAAIVAPMEGESATPADRTTEPAAAIEPALTATVHQEEPPAEVAQPAILKASGPLTSRAEELCPEDAATVMAAASEELKPEDGHAVSSATNEAIDGPSARLNPDLRPSSSDWAFEEALANHREWVESKGLRGKKADLADAQLEGVELINVNLRLADLHYADLKSADLLLADLRDACLVRADLEEACLVGANLEGANLEGASLETALGLVPRQLAGTNLREASLPSQIVQFPAAATFRTASRTALRFFTALMTLSAVSALAIWRTKDIQLVTDSAILPFLHSAKAAAAMPSAEIFLITPVMLFLLYLAFLAQVQRMWGAALELPAIFPDGSTLGEKEPGIILGLLRAQFRWMNHDAPSARTLETTLSLLAAYWVVPAMLFLFWARYLTLQEMHGTFLHELLASVAAGVALHATFKVGRPQEKWALQQTFASRISERLRGSRPPVLVAILFAITTFISVGTVYGVPHDRSRAPQYGAANIRRWAPSVLWSVGFDPYADLTEAQISTPPAGWDWSNDTVGSVRGAHLNSPRFRYAQAYGVFFANAHLWHADFRGAYLSNSDFRGADLTQSNFQYSIVDDGRINHANLDRAILQNGHFARTDFSNANLSYASLTGAFLMDAHFDGASLYDAQLSNSTLVRAAFPRTDLRNARIDSANLEHADLRNAYLWSATVQNSDMKDADLGAAILIGASLRGSNLGGAHFAQTVLNETDFTGTVLDGADMRGAFGLAVYQVCSSKSHAGALFDDSLQPLVDAQCPSH
jgi:uncharacterized protein YjbI with pentapeptide repeats